MTQLSASICLLFLGTSFLFARSVTMIRNTDKNEEVTLSVPDSWIVSQEDPGTDFIRHNMIAKSTEGGQTIRMGWLSNTEVPASMSDELVQTFESQINDWLAVHQISGKITGTREITLSGRAIRLVQLELTQGSTSSEVDYYMVLGRDAVYIIAAYHAPDAQMDDLVASLQSIEIRRHSIVEKPLPSPYPSSNSLQVQVGGDKWGVVWSEEKMGSNPVQTANSPSETPYFWDSTLGQFLKAILFTIGVGSRIALSLGLGRRRRVK